MATRPPTLRRPRLSEPTPKFFAERVAWGVAHDAFLDAIAQLHLQFFQAGDDSPEVLRVLEGALKVCEYAEAARLKRRLRRPDGLVSGGLALELVDDLGTVRFAASELCAHFMEVGPSGRGKTTFHRGLSAQFAADPTVHQTAIDIGKTELRSLLPVYNAQGAELTIVRPAELALNVVRPPGLSPAQAYAVMPSLLANTLRCPPGTEAFLRQEYGVLQQTRPDFSPAEFFEHLRGAAAAFELAKVSGLSKLAPVFRELLPTATRTREGWPLTTWRTENIVLELGTLSETAKTLVVMTLLYGLLGDAAAAPGVHVVFLDDAAPLFVTDAAQPGRGSFPSILSLVRAQRVAFGFGLQSLEGVALDALANVGTRFVLGASPEDLVRVAAHLGLRPEQFDELRGLKRGEALVQLPGHLWPEPFAIRVPDAPQIPVDDATVALSARRARTWPCTLAHEFPPTWLPDLRPLVMSRADRAAGPPVSGGVPAHERRFLEAVLAFPGLAASQLARKAGLKDSRAIVIRESLVTRGWLRVHKVQRTPRGRASQVLEVTPEGVRALRGQRIPERGNEPGQTKVGEGP